MDPNQIVRLFPVPLPIQIEPLSGGANNRVYKLEFEDRSPLILKQYFQDVRDQRPRLHSEFSFLQYAWKIGLRVIPEPLFISMKANAALYSYIPARPILLSDINENLVQQKISFFQYLNEQKNKASHLGKASEACLSPSEYLEITEKRIFRLSQHVEEKELKTFVDQKIFPKWMQLKTKCKAALHTLSGQVLPMEDQCISPSDFGFHNALICDGKLTFIDFEYAGWDDPCKTVCDLFCQPKIPLPIQYFNLITKAFSLCVQDPESFLKRVEIFYPVMQMKWCCIILNAFTHVGKSRRAFSQSKEYLEKQLFLAKERLQQIAI